MTSIKVLLHAGGEKLFIERLAIGALMVALVFFYVQTLRERCLARR
jgi:hypothetical protein